jgi:UDP-N-acetylmuramoylalanine--D-glutamate ligase
MANTFRILVVGAGISGVDAAILCKKKGFEVVLSDTNHLSTEDSKRLDGYDIEVKIGPQDSSLLSDINEIVLSPGVPLTIPIIQEAQARRLPIYSEVQFSLRFLPPSKIFVVTGTNGKSTVCMMTEHMLLKQGFKAKAAGNIGTTVASLAADDASFDALVLELSSYQLEHTSHMGIDVGMFTTFSYDHISRHKTLNGYFAAKWKMLDFIKPGGLFITTSSILEYAQANGFNLSSAFRTIAISFEGDDLSKLLPLQKSLGVEIASVGENFDVMFSNDKSMNCNLMRSSQETFHNKTNALFSALTVSTAFQTPLANVLELAADYEHLPFRCELIGKVGENPCWNDSKSTNVESTVSALQGHTRPVILLIGGRPKGESYFELIKYKNSIQLVLTFGEAGEQMYRELSAHLPTLRFATLAECLLNIKELYERHPSPILFSPACASFDEFDNFEDRGRFFTARMKELFSM